MLPSANLLCYCTSVLHLIAVARLIATSLCCVFQSVGIFSSCRLALDNTVVGKQAGTTAGLHAGLHAGLQGWMPTSQHQFAIRHAWRFCTPAAPSCPPPSCPPIPSGHHRRTQSSWQANARAREDSGWSRQGVQAFRQGVQDRARVMSVADLASKTQVMTTHCQTTPELSAQPLVERNSVTSSFDRRSCRLLTSVQCSGWKAYGLLPAYALLQGGYKGAARELSAYWSMIAGPK